MFEELKLRPSDDDDDGYDGLIAINCDFYVISDNVFYAYNRASPYFQKIKIKTEEEYATSHSE